MQTPTLAHCILVGIVGLASASCADADHPSTTEHSDPATAATGAAEPQGTFSGGYLGAGPGKRLKPGAEERSPCHLDEHSPDWSQLAPLVQGNGQAARRMSVFHDRENQLLHVCVEGKDLGAHYELFVDTDGDPATGVAEGEDAKWQSTGLDRKVVDGAIYPATPKHTWDTSSGTTLHVHSQSSSAVSVQIPLGLLGDEFAPYFTLAFRDLSTGWATASRLPVSGQLPRLVKPPSATSGGGIIVPMYSLPTGIIGSEPRGKRDCTQPKPKPKKLPGQPASAHEIALDGVWKRLSEQASVMSAGKHYKDFWVVVSGQDSRPFADPADFMRATKSWDPIREHGGKIIGYVHTLADVDCSIQYRSVAEVMQDVHTWVREYPAVAGIWLDEFYPRYEYGEANESLRATLPNGPDYAPTALRNARETVLEDKQISYEGGYYHQLTTAIRAAYPHLKLIGNAGGPLRSNQWSYGALVDVLCTFEQTHAEAIKEDWKDLTSVPLLPTTPLLSLIHTMPAEPCRTGGHCAQPKLEDTLNRAIEHGYAYFFATEDPLATLWQNLPSYLEAEVELLARRPAPGATR